MTIASVFVHLADKMGGCWHANCVRHIPIMITLQQQQKKVDQRPFVAVKKKKKSTQIWPGGEQTPANPSHDRQVMYVPWRTRVLLPEGIGTEKAR